MRFFATRQLSVAEADAAVHDVPDAEQAVPQNAAGPPADRDAALRFAGTRDRMKVGVARYTPPAGNGRPLTIDRIREQLHEAGVRVALLEDAARKLLHCIETGAPYDRIVLAKGSMPVNGSDAYIVPYGNFNYPAFPGQKIGSRTAGYPPVPGMRIDGSEIPVQSAAKPRDIEFSPECNCYLEDDTSDVTATVYGLVQVADTSLTVQPQVTVTPDSMQVRATVYFRDMEGRPVTVERMVLMLQAMDVPVELADRKDIKQAIVESEQSANPVRDVVVAQGREPRHGADGWVEIITRTANEHRVGREVGQGRMDFRNRGVTPTVRRGEPFAIIHPPVGGVDGMNVLGKPLPAREGTAVAVTLDSSAAFAPDGRTVVALRDGLAQFAGGVLSVQEVVQIPGDVDFSSGNVQIAAGSVDVKGAVLSGFCVKAPGSLVVGDVIESARIVAGGNVSVSGGIVMQGKGFVRCGGTVTARFISEAVVEAREDVVVKDALLHSTVMCGGKVLALSGKGRIQGGSITCRSGLHALELGSELGAATQVTLAVSSKLVRELEKERDVLKDALEKIALKFGDADDETILMGAKPEHYKAVESALTLRATVTAKLAAIREQLAEARRKASHSLFDAEVRVSGVVHPGTVITMGEAVFAVSHPMQAAVFRLSPETRSIEVTGV